MIMGTISELCRSLYGPEGGRGLTTEGSEANGPDAAGRVVTVAPIHFLRNGPPGPQPASRGARGRAKSRLARDNGEGQTGEDGQRLLAHGSER